MTPTALDSLEAQTIGNAAGNNWTDYSTKTCAALA